MEFIECKKKKMELINKVNDHAFVVKYKKKILFLHVFSNFDEFNSYMLNYKKLKTTGVKIPKIYYVDKKNFSCACEYIDGPTVLELISKNDLNENIYEQIFLMSWYAKNDGLLLNFMPENYRYFNKTLFYIPLTFEKYNEKDSFHLKGIQYWVYSNTLVNYLKQNNLPVDLSRRKDEYLTNKEIVLKTVKYYH